MKKYLVLTAFILALIPAMKAQDAVNSVNVNICNVQLSPDAKTLTYDVYLQSKNPDTVIAVPGFVFRMAIPQADLGSGSKRISITNANEELGVQAEAITAANSDWVVKFLNKKLILSYEEAMKISAEYPGNKLGTVNISNTDGSKFSDPLTVNLNFPGMSVPTKATCSVFVPNSLKLASNSTKALPETNFNGLGSFTVSSLDSKGFTFSPNPATKSITVKTQGKTQELSIFDLSGKKVMSKAVTGEEVLNISTLPAGSYMLDINGTRKKLIKQ